MSSGDEELLLAYTAGSYILAMRPKTSGIPETVVCRIFMFMLYHAIPFDSYHTRIYFTTVIQTIP